MCCRCKSANRHALDIPVSVHAAFRSRLYNYSSLLTEARKHATKYCTADRAKFVSKEVLLKAGLAELVMHAGQQLRVMGAGQTDAAPSVMRHVYQLQVCTVNSMNKNIQMTLNIMCGTAKLRNLCIQWSALRVMKRQLPPQLTILLVQAVHQPLLGRLHTSSWQQGSQMLEIQLHP